MLNSVDVKLQYDDKNKAELIENAEIKNTEPSDFGEIVRILSHTFEYDGYGMPPHQILNLMEMELRSSRVDLANSVKLVDKRDGKIYGLLVFSHYNLATGSPLLTRKSTAMIAEYLMGYSQINGFAFLIDKRLRGVGLDRKMIVFAEPFLKQFDFVWCATEYDSKSNAYWQRYGFVQIWEDEDSCFYIRNTGKSNMNDVLILKMASEALNSKENAKEEEDYFDHQFSSPKEYREKTTEELLENAVFSSVEEDDFEDISRLIERGITMRTNLASLQSSYESLYDLQLNLDKSVKLFDKRDGEILGFILLSEADIRDVLDEEAFIGSIDEAIDDASFVGIGYFYIDERLRGYRYDKKMINMVYPYIATFDVAWALISPNRDKRYFERQGFFYVYQEGDVQLYVALPPNSKVSKKTFIDIRNKMANENF